MLSRIKNRIPPIDLPLLRQELRVRQRGVKPFAIMFVYVLVLSAVAMIALALAFRVMGHGAYQSNSSRMAEIGRALFTALMVAQLVLISLIVPAYSSGAVSSERERGTFDLLILTLLSSPSIVVQKLAAAVGQAVMLTIASVPVVSIVFLIGGVSPNEVAVAYAMLLLEAAMFGALGLLCSCQFRLTRTSTFVAYLTVLAFLVGLPLLGELLDRLRYSRAIGEGFSFTVVGLYAFVCGVGALFLFAMLSLWASRRLKHWPSRSFRMCVFGGIYAVIALVLSSPTTCNAVISALYGAQGNMFLPLFVNPFVAMAVLMYDQAAIGGYYNEQYWIIGATCGFALACAYLFEHLAAYRFEAMRKL